jgi:hypothetical protein
VAIILCQSITIKPIFAIAHFHFSSNSIAAFQQAFNQDSSLSLMMSSNVCQSMPIMYRQIAVPFPVSLWCYKFVVCQVPFPNPVPRASR